MVKMKIKMVRKNCYKNDANRRICRSREIGTLRGALLNVFHGETVTAAIQASQTSLQEMFVLQRNLRGELKTKNVIFSKFYQFL
jgi:hypothetical protein